MNDTVKIHWKSALPALVLGAMLGWQGISRVPGLESIAKKQVEEMCATTVNALIVDGMHKTASLEKRVAVLETALYMNGITIPE